MSEENILRPKSFSQPSNFKYNEPPETRSKTYSDFQKWTIAGMQKTDLMFKRQEKRIVALEQNLLELRDQALPVHTTTCRDLQYREKEVYVFGKFLKIILNLKLNLN